MNGTIRLWDIETGYNIAVIWDLVQHSKYISYTSLLQERYIMMAAIKDLGDDRVYQYKITDYPEFKKDPTNDKKLVRDIRDHLIDSDALIHHNGDNFDLPYLNGRLLYWGYKPLPSMIQIDTKKIAKNKFRFNSNRLDYLAQFLKVGKKNKVEQEDWLGALRGDRASVEKLAAYNVVDVEVLEKVYVKLAPFAESKLNQAVFNDGEKPVCPLCGSEHLHRRGSRYTRTGEYERYECQACGHWSQGTRTIKRARLKSK